MFKGLTNRYLNSILDRIKVHFCLSQLIQNQPDNTQFLFLILFVVLSVLADQACNQDIVIFFWILLVDLFV